MINFILSLFNSEPKQESSAATAEALKNAEYTTSKPQWSFSLSITLDKPVDEVTSKLGRLDGFETVSRLNPVCIEFTQISRDWVLVPGQLVDSRVRELPGCISPEEEVTHIKHEGGRRFERIRFQSKDSLTAFWGFLKDVIPQRGTYVWDEEEKIGLWEVTTTIDKPNVETWLRKVVRYVDAGEGKTKVDEFLEGYSKETLPILEGFTKRYTMDLHKNWMNKYHEAL